MLNQQGNIFCYVGLSYTLVAMILVENKMLTTLLWRSEHLILNKDLSAGSDLRWWPSELTNERAPAGADLVHHTTQSKCATNTSHHAILTSCYPVLLKLLGSLIVLVQFLSNGKALSTRLHGAVGWAGRWKRRLTATLLGASICLPYPGFS